MRILKFVKNFYIYLFPLMQAKSITMWACDGLLFDHFTSSIEILEKIFIIILYILTMLTGFRIPYFVNFRLIRSNVLGPIGQLLCFAAALGFVEIFILRIWTLLVLRKYRFIRKIDFVKLVEKLNPKAQSSILYWSKILFFETSVSAYIFFALTNTIEMINSTNTLEILTTIFWSIGYIEIVRVGIHYVPILYTFSVAGFKIVMDSIELLKQMVINTQILHSMNQIEQIYFDYISSVKKLNTLTGMLLFTSNLLVIPMTSGLVFLALIPADSTLLMIYKVLIFVTGTFYSIRGYIFIVILAQVNTRSKCLYQSINSSIARRRVVSVINVRKLNLILEDLASPMSHTVVRGFNYAVTQMDAYNSIISTASMITLYFSFEGILT